MKRFALLLLAAALLLSFSACGGGAASDPKVNFGVLKGPTGVGAAPFLRDHASGYNITLASDPTNLTALLINGELDIACLPTNVAATLYNKTDGGVRMLALITKSMLYILENGGRIQSMGDLRGRTLYATGQGANPEYVLDYLLTQNGLTPGQDVQIVWEDSDTLSAQAASGDVDLAMLPVPAATSVTLKNPDMRYALDLGAEWDKMDNGSGMYMSCVVVRTAFLQSRIQETQRFLEDFSASLDSMINFASGAQQPAFDVGQLLADLQIVGSADVGNAALPYAGLCDLKGAEMRVAVSGYYQVLFDADPSSIGGAVPGDDFYSDLNL